MSGQPRAVSISCAGLPNAWGCDPTSARSSPLPAPSRRATRTPPAAPSASPASRSASAIELGFGAEHSHAIAVGVVCADIGKIGLPDRLLHGRGQLSDEDYATLRSYPAMSSYILGELELPALVKEMARWHLERWDGDGGPDGLAGEAIPIFARILSVADAVDATSFAAVADAGRHPLLPDDRHRSRALPRGRPRPARLHRRHKGPVPCPPQRYPGVCPFFSARVAGGTDPCVAM